MDYQKEECGSLKKILLISMKGGVGKTTTTVGLARSLSKNHSVGLVDVDLDKPSCHLAFNIGKNVEAKVVGEKFHPIKVEGIKFISNALLFGRDATAIWTKRDKAEAALQLLELTELNTDYTLIDSPPGLTESLQLVLKYGKIDGGIIVSTPSPMDLDGAKRTLFVAREFGLPLLGVILNRYYSEHVSKKIWWDIGYPHRIRVSLPILGIIPEDPKIAQTMRVEGIEPIAQRVIQALKKPVIIKRETITRKLKRAATKFMVRRLS